MGEIIDLTGIASEEQLYQTVQPAAYNLDALYDALTERADVTVRVSRTVLETALGARAQVVMRLLEDTQQENSGLVLQYTE